MMRNQFRTHIELERIDICDLMLACTSAYVRQKNAGEGGEKWKRLHDKLKEQLKDLDAQLDDLEGES